MDKCICFCESSYIKDFNITFFKGEWYRFQISQDGTVYYLYHKEVNSTPLMLFDEESFYSHFKDMSTFIDEKISNILK